MSFENEVKEEDEEESDTLNDSDNIDSQLGSSNKGKKIALELWRNWSYSLQV